MEYTTIPHDAAYKSIFSHPEMVESLLKDFVPPKYIEGIRFETLAPLKADFISDTLKRLFADSIWKVECGGVTHFILIQLEFQSTVDPWMAVRMANYCTSLWLELTKFAPTQETLTPEGKLPPILPIVIYNGERRWTAKTSIKELLPMERGYLLAYQPLQSYILLDEGRMDDGELASKEGLAALIIRAQKATDATELITILRELIERLKKPEHASLTRSLVGWFKLLMRKGGFGKKVDEVESLTEVKSMLAERIVQWRDEFVRGEFARGKAEGIAEGKAEGRAEGKAEGKAEAMTEVARAMLEAAIPVEQIARLTGFSVEQVYALHHEQ